MPNRGLKKVDVEVLGEASSKQNNDSCALHGCHILQAPNAWQPLSEVSTQAAARSNSCATRSWGRHFCTCSFVKGNALCPFYRPFESPSAKACPVHQPVSGQHLPTKCVQCIMRCLANTSPAVLASARDWPTRHGKNRACDMLRTAFTTSCDFVPELVLREGTPLVVLPNVAHHRQGLDLCGASTSSCCFCVLNSYCHGQGPGLALCQECLFCQVHAAQLVEACEALRSSASA